MLGADRARRTEPPLRGKTKNKYSAPLMGQAFIPLSSTTTPGWPTPRSTTTKPLSPRLPSLSVPSSGSRPAVLPSSGSSCPTTVAPTDHTCDAIPAQSSEYGTSARDRITRKPTARSSGATGRWLTAGPTPAATHPKPNAAVSSMTGCTTTTTTDPTQPAGTSPAFSRLINVSGQYS